MGRAVVVGADGTEGPGRVLAVTVRAALAGGMGALVAETVAVAGEMDRDVAADVAAIVRSRALVAPASASSPS